MQQMEDHAYCCAISRREELPEEMPDDASLIGMDQRPQMAEPQLRSIVAEHIAAAGVRIENRSLLSQDEQAIGTLGKQALNNRRLLAGAACTSARVQQAPL